MKAQKLFLTSALSVGAALCATAWVPVIRFGHAPFRTLIVGGGPDQEHNQVAIESNVRYLGRIIPSGSPTRVLFTDGNPDSKNIQCQGDDSKVFYKKTDIERIDGPSEISSIKKELSSISADVANTPEAPVLLYFTGHGSPNQSSKFNNNAFDLWNSHAFTVRDFADSLKNFPKTTPITLVMVECFSGSFGNLLFQDGDVANPLADLNLCGFFASVAMRPAAGCTAELKEANYRDFTSYFFAALSGTDRLGNTVSGADYNHDGVVGMNEAFAYTLIHDDSIDTPVCTSDVFLRKFIVAEDAKVMETSYASVLKWASPAQLAALTSLSDAIKAQGDDRIQLAYDEFMHMSMSSDEPHDVHLIRFVRLAKSIILGHMLQQTGTPEIKARYAALIKAESGNPIR